MRGIVRLGYVPYRDLARIRRRWSRRSGGRGISGAGRADQRGPGPDGFRGLRSGAAARDGPRSRRGAHRWPHHTVRLFGLIRTLAFSQTVGASCLGTAYVTANQVPNLVYELVLGGALTSAMIPLLARSAERADADPAERAHVSQIPQRC